MKWKGWYSVFTGIPNFSLFISTAWLNSPLNKATRDTCDLHNHTFPEQPSRQNLDQKIWKLERVAYLAMETDETMFADQFAGHFTIACARGPRGEEHLTIAWVKWVLELEIRVEWKSVKVKKWLFRQIACSARTSKGTDYIRTAFLKVWCIWCIRTRSIVIFL